MMLLCNINNLTFLYVSCQKWDSLSVVNKKNMGWDKESVDIYIPIDYSYCLLVMQLSNESRKYHMNLGINTGCMEMWIVELIQQHHWESKMQKKSETMVLQTALCQKTFLCLGNIFNMGIVRYWSSLR